MKLVPRRADAAGARPARRPGPSHGHAMARSPDPDGVRGRSAAGALSRTRLGSLRLGSAAWYVCHPPRTWYMPSPSPRSVPILVLLLACACACILVPLRTHAIICPAPKSERLCSCHQAAMLMSPGGSNKSARLLVGFSACSRPLFLLLTAGRPATCGLAIRRPACKMHALRSPCSSLVARERQQVAPSS